MSEQLDYFDSAMRLLGRSDRDTVHRNGWWHQTFHCWIVQSSGRLLFQRRSRHKSDHAGLLDISAAGHLLSGETAMDGLRELQEELGVAVQMTDLVPLGIRIHTAMPGGKLDHEFSHEFLLTDDRPLLQYRLQPEEVEGIFSADLDQATGFFAGRLDTLAMNGVKLSDKNRLKEVEIHVRAIDIVPRIGPYYLTVCLMARRHLDRQPVLSI